MGTAVLPRWNDLDPGTRAALDAQYLKELDSWQEPGLSDEAVRLYLEYRHERPGATITTYEEGQIKRLLHPFADPSVEPDPVALEEHHGRLEHFCAEKLHFTNVGAYVAVMMAVIYGVLLVWLLYSMLG